MAGKYGTGSYNVPCQFFLYKLSNILFFMFIFTIIIIIIIIIKPTEKLGVGCFKETAKGCGPVNSDSWGYDPRSCWATPKIAQVEFKSFWIDMFFFNVLIYIYIYIRTYIYIHYILLYIFEQDSTFLSLGVAVHDLPLTKNLLQSGRLIGHVMKTAPVSPHLGDIGSTSMVSQKLESLRYCWYYLSNKS